MQLQLLKLLGDFVPRLLTGAWLLDHTGRGLAIHTAPLTALSANESLCFSLLLCFSNDVCSAPNPWRPAIRGTGSQLGDTDKNVGPALPLLFIVHEIWTADFQENY